MAELDLQIPLPVLVANQGFKVEYRVQGSPTWVLWGVEDNDPFTITGLTAGQIYEVQFTLLISLSPRLACEPEIRTYYIPDEIPCIEAEGEIAQSGDVWLLTVTVTYPSPYVAPCGGYELVYGTTAPYKTVPYAALPNPLVLPATNDVYYVAIYALDCDGNRVKCWEDYIVPTAAPCVHASVNSASLYVGSNGLYYLSITITPSSPLSTAYDIAYAQNNAVTSGVIDNGGVPQKMSSGTNPETFVIQVNPNPNIQYINGQYTISYHGIISDRCDYSSPFTATYTVDT